MPSCRLRLGRVNWGLCLMQQSKSWSLPTRYFVLILLLGVILWLAISARDLLGPLALSALLAYVLNPLVNRVSSRSHLSRQIVVALVYVIFLAALITVVAIVAPIVPVQLANLVDQMDTITQLVEDVLRRPIIFFNFEIPLDAILANWPAMTEGVSRPDLLINVLTATSTNLVWVTVVIVTTYYLLLDWRRLREWLINLVPVAYQPDMRHLYVDIRNVWGRYFAGQLRLMLVVGVLTGLAAALIGLPGAVAFGVLAAVFDIILTVGPLIVTIIAAIVAFVSGSTFLPISNIWFMLLVVAVFSLIQVLENMWLRPRIMSHQLRLHPAVVFVAIVASLSLVGILMALIIVPLISSTLVVGYYLYCKIFDLDPWPEDSPEEASQDSQAELHG